MEMPKAFKLQASPYLQTEFFHLGGNYESKNPSLSCLRIAKAIFLGDVAVGKTCIINRFVNCNDYFNITRYVSLSKIIIFNWRSNVKNYNCFIKWILSSFFWVKVFFSIGLFVEQHIATLCSRLNPYFFFVFYLFFCNLMKRLKFFFFLMNKLHLGIYYLLNDTKIVILLVQN